MKVRVRAFHMSIGVDLIGSKTSASSGMHGTIEALPFGLLMYSNKTKRSIIIPYSNVKGFELMPDVTEDELDTLRSWGQQEKVSQLKVAKGK